MDRLQKAFVQNSKAIGNLATHALNPRPNTKWIFKSSETVKRKYKSNNGDLVVCETIEYLEEEERIINNRGLTDADIHIWDVDQDIPQLFRESSQTRRSLVTRNLERSIRDYVSGVSDGLETIPTDEQSCVEVKVISSCVRSRDSPFPINDMSNTPRYSGTPT